MTGCLWTTIGAHRCRAEALEERLKASSAEPKATRFSSRELAATGPNSPVYAMPPLGPFTIQALEGAINRARQAHPASGTEARLSPEVAKLAALYGWMIYEQRQELSPDLLNADEMEALSQIH